MGKDEQIIKEYTFVANLILFWLNANYSLTNKRLIGYQPNTLLGLIPLGKAEVVQPLKNIASVSSSTEFHFAKLLIGVILLFVGMGAFGNSFLLGVILIVLGGINLLNCYTSTFIVLNNGGAKVGYNLSILDKSKVDTFVMDVNSAIAEL
jgi:hypothetical protein